MIEDKPADQPSVIATLDDLGVEYTVRRHTRSALTAELAAAERDVRLAQIVKCLVAQTETELLALLLPGDRKLNAALARKRLGARSLEFAPREALEQLGLVVGAISPVQLIGRARIVFDPSVLDEEFVDISTGDPASGIELRSRDLLRLLNAEVLDITSDSA
jgi:Cys-tRNA(Pro)/Cys-tRNA(Cys) deacylase